MASKVRKLDKMIPTYGFIVHEYMNNVIVIFVHAATSKFSCRFNETAKTEGVFAF